MVTVPCNSTGGAFGRGGVCGRSPEGWPVAFGFGVGGVWFAFVGWAVVVCVLLLSSRPGGGALKLAGGWAAFGLGAASGVDFAGGDSFGLLCTVLGVDIGVALGINWQLHFGGLFTGVASFGLICVVGGGRLGGCLIVICGCLLGGGSCFGSGVVVVGSSSSRTGSCLGGGVSCC